MAGGGNDGPLGGSASGGAGGVTAPQAVAGEVAGEMAEAAMCRLTRATDWAVIRVGAMVAVAVDGPDHRALAEHVGGRARPARL